MDLPVSALRKQRERSDRPLAVLDDHNPAGLARSFMRQYGLFGNRDEDELLSVAMMAVVDAALSWDTNGGSFPAWAYGYMRTYVFKHLRKSRRHDAQLGKYECVSVDPDRFGYRSGTDDFNRVELRVDLQRLADLARLNPLQRFMVEFVACHSGVRVLTRNHTYNSAIKHMRQAAITNEPRDDMWTRRRDREQLDSESLRQVEAWKEKLDKYEANKTDGRARPVDAA